jgi:hypothetical protein
MQLIFKNTTKSLHKLNPKKQYLKIASKNLVPESNEIIFVERLQTLISLLQKSPAEKSTNEGV